MENDFKKAETFARSALFNGKASIRAWHAVFDLMFEWLTLNLLKNIGLYRGQIAKLAT